MEHKQIISYRLLSLVLGMLLIAGNLIAQPPQRGGMQGPPPLPDSTQIVKMVDELAEEISLSKKQKAQVSDLYFAHFEEAKELVKEHKDDREEHREAMDAIKKEFIVQIKDILTEDQVEEFEEYVENRQKQQRGNRPKRR